jgi:hypothetical protein
MTMDLFAKAMRLAIVSKDLDFVTITKQECELKEQIVKVSHSSTVQEHYPL